VIAPREAFINDVWLGVCRNSGSLQMDVLDPFTIREGRFILDFDTFMIHPNLALSPSIKQQILATLKRLKLNIDEACVEARREWYECYSSGRMEFSTLEDKAPFVAYEARRQGLVP
jgi:hypothetical protein